MSVKETLKATREARGWSQRELSRRAHVSVSYISMLERGDRSRVSGDILLRIAQVLGVTVDALLNGDEPSIDTSEPPADLWRALHWPEKLIADGIRDWAIYSDAQRLNLIEQAETLAARQSQVSRSESGV